jgi:hypothetical protein
MDRKLYKLPFPEGRSPDWMCPTCGKGVLRIKNGTFHREELRDSREAHSHEAWDPEWIRYVYSCLLECTNDQCKEIVANSGKGDVGYDVIQDHNGNLDEVYADFFRPTFFEPPLVLIQIPDDCPSQVASPLRDSFRLFFSNPSAASNNVRVALEELLTELGVKRFVVKNKKRSYIPLHTRIGLLPLKYADIKDLFVAIKWLGNAGSHAGGVVTLDDVMDAYELIEHVLQEIYAPKAKTLKALAKRVNRKKGPAK